MYEVYSMYATDSLCLGSVWGLGSQTRRASGSYRAGAASRDRDVSGAAGALLAVVHVDGSLPGCSGLWARLELVLPPGLDVLGCAWACLVVPPGLAVPGSPMSQSIDGAPMRWDRPPTSRFVLVRAARSACCIFGSQSIPACLQTPRPAFVVAHI